MKQPKILFFESSHTYLANAREEEGDPIWVKWPSMSSLVTTHDSEFDDTYWLRYKSFEETLGGKDKFKAAKEYYGYKGVKSPPVEFFKRIWVDFDDYQRTSYEIAKEKIQGEWWLKNMSRSSKGTIYHKVREDEDIAAGGTVNPVTGVFQKIPIYINRDLADSHSLVHDLYTLPDGYYPELLIFDPELEILGQVDRAWIWTIDGDRFYCSSDYKTNFEKRKKKGWEKLKAPFNQMDNGSVSKYTVQQSGYAYMMERWGYNISTIQLEWVEDFGKGKVEIMELQYIKDEMELAFRKLKEQRRY